jgi:hypothetical protein
MVTLEGDGTFLIERVEQGDKLNPLLFNAAKFRTTFAK